jgi:hypothetical protein
MSMCWAHVLCTDVLNFDYKDYQKIFPPAQHDRLREALSVAYLDIITMCSRRSLSFFQFLDFTVLQLPGLYPEEDVVLIRCSGIPLCYQRAEAERNEKTAPALESAIIKKLRILRRSIQTA